jgi:hypothetical protein
MIGLLVADQWDLWLGEATTQADINAAIALLIESGETKKDILKLSEYLVGSPALLLSKENPFKIYKLLKQSKSAAAIKVKESKNSEAISHVSGMKMKARTVNSFISPAPILARKISGVKSNTEKPVSGYTSFWVATLSESRDRKVIQSTRFDMRWWRISTKDM